MTYTCPVCGGWSTQHVCREALLDAFLVHTHEKHTIGHGPPPYAVERARRAAASHDQCTSVCAAGSLAERMSS